MRKTAIVLLIEELTKNGFNFQNYQNEIMKLKEIEKEIITEAYSQGRIDSISKSPYATDGEYYYKTEFYN